MESIRRAVRRCYSVEVELAFVALVLIAWQAARIPIEGSVGVSLAHARSVVGLEEALRLDVEPWLVGVAAGSALETALAWLYANVHLPVLFGFMVAFRVLAPDRYPRIRTTFVVSFLPAIFVIGLYPLAPPHWLPELGLGGPPTNAELTASGAVFHNTTAAAASQHFGFAVFVAATSIWLFPRSCSWSSWAREITTCSTASSARSHSSSALSSPRSCTTARAQRARCGRSTRRSGSGSGTR